MFDVTKYLQDIAGKTQTFDDMLFIDPLSLSFIDGELLSSVDIHFLGGIPIMLNVADLMLTSLDTITAWNMDDTLAFVLDELESATISNTEDREELTGKGGRTIGSLKRNKGVTISGSNGMLSGGLLEVQTGGAFEAKTAAPVLYQEYLTINSNAATTTYKGVGTAGAEIAELYLITAGVATAKLTQDTTVAAGKFTYDPTTKALAFNSGDYEDGTEILVFYTRNVAASVLANDSDNYSGKVKLYIDGTAEDKCSNVYHVQFYIPKADFSGEFDIDLGDNQTMHDFEATALAGGSCSGAAAAGVLWTYTVFGVDTADA